MATFFAIWDKFFLDCEYVKITIFAIFLVQSTCQIPSLDGPTSRVLGSSVHLICTLPGSSAPLSTLSFNRAGVLGSPCTINIAACLQFTANDGSFYSCGCVTGQTGEFYLNISSLRKQDDDTWTCTSNGSNSNNFSLSVYFAPVISSSLPKNKDVIENSSANIDCSSNLIAGKPSDTSYTWTGPGRYNKSGSVLNRNISRSHGGSYTCTARNSAGLSDSTQVNINVQYAPVISSSFPNNKDVTENVSLNIDCSSGLTAGNPSNTSYTWTGQGGYSKSGSVLDRRVSRTQGGSYTCTARNSVGLSDSAQININVQYAPVISSSFPNNKDVTENSSPNIDCSSGLTAGKPSNTSYTWTGPAGYNKSGSVLDRKISRSQGGSYTCTAYNSVGLSDSAHVNINVQYAPEISSSFPNNKEVTENSSPNIDCSSGLTAGNPSDTSYTWTGPEDYSESGSVLDRRVNRSQDGSYTCEARNSAGLSDSAQVTITVQYMDAPVLTISPPEVMENDSVRLECRVSSNPTAEMTISNLDNSTDLVDGEMTNTRQLDIDSAQCLHNGTVQCVVNNRALSRNVTVTKDLSVLCLPRYDVRKNRNTTVAAELNDTAQFVAGVIANPSPNFTWGRLEGDNLLPIRSSTISLIHSSKLKSVLHINVTSSKDYGKYAVMVQNMVGETLLKYQLTAKAAPFLPTNFKETIIGPKFVGMEWISNFNGGAPQTFFLEYKVHGRWKNLTTDGIRDPGRDQVVVYNVTKDVKSASLYFFQLYTTNIYGTSPKLTLNITTLKDSDEGTLNVAAVAGGISAALLVIIIVAGVSILYKRGVYRQCCWSEGKRNGDQSSSRRRRENFVMGESVVNRGSGEQPGGTSGGMTDVYAVVEKKRKPIKARGDVYAQVKLNKAAQPGDIYENTTPGQFLAVADADANTYANVGFVGDDYTSDDIADVQNPQPPTGLDADGCLYIGIDFSNHKPRKVIIGKEKGSYVDIAYGKVGPPPPPDEDEEEEEKKKATASK